MSIYVALYSTPTTVPDSYTFNGGEVVPFMAGQSIDWTIQKMSF